MKIKCSHCNQEIEGTELYIISHLTVCSVQMAAQKESIQKYDSEPKKDFNPKHK
jgi:hypothetical protein